MKLICAILITGAFCFFFSIGLISWAVYFEVKDSLHAEHRTNIMKAYEVTK